MTVPSAFGLLAKTCALPLFHIEMKMTLVGFIGIRPKHRAEGFARLIVDKLQTYACRFRCRLVPLAGHHNLLLGASTAG
jgi:hypothetical protein